MKFASWLWRVARVLYWACAIGVYVVLISGSLMGGDWEMGGRRIGNAIVLIAWPVAVLVGWGLVSGLRRGLRRAPSAEGA